MSTTVFFAVIGAAVLHASWNALVKSGADKLLGIGAIMIGHLPFAVLCLLFVPAPAPESWVFLCGGIVLHAGYQFFLLNSYKLGDLTQVYPIARGSAPLLVALFSVLVLQVALSKMELLAVVVIGVGIVSLGLVRKSDGQRNPHAAISALITGCFIASYSLVDGMGARLAGTAVGFFAWLSIANGILMICYILAVRPTILKQMVSSHLSLCLVGGGASFAAYAIVTWAFTQAPIALVTALRETSIVFALLIGVFFLKERIDLVKVFSTFTTLAGALLLRFGK